MCVGGGGGGGGGGEQNGFGKTIFRIFINAIGTASFRISVNASFIIPKGPCTGSTTKRISVQLALLQRTMPL